MMRDGMEALEMTAARMEELGMPGIGPEFAVTCEDHGGTGMAIMQQWDGTQWVTLTDFIAPDDSVTQPLVMETLLEVNNIEVIYNHVILVLKGVSLKVPKAGSPRCSAATVRARRPR
jgi:branched-chain amino acid transport system substrate-binding protein